MVQIDWNPKKYFVLSRHSHQIAFRLICENYLPLSTFAWPARALDLGTGTGDVAKVITHLENFSEVFAVDIDPKLVEFSKGQNVDERIKFFTGDACKFDTFPQQAETEYNLVTAVATVHWWSDPQQGIVNAFRVLKPGGYFIGYCWAGKDVYRKCVESAVDMSPWIKEKYGKKFSKRLDDLDETLWWTTPDKVEGRLSAYLLNAGFTIIKCQLVKHLVHRTYKEAKGWYQYLLETLGGFDGFLAETEEGNKVAAEVAENMLKLRKWDSCGETVLDPVLEVVEFVCVKGN